MLSKEEQDAREREFGQKLRSYYACEHCLDSGWMQKPDAKPGSGFDGLMPCPTCKKVEQRRQLLLGELNQYDAHTMARMTFAAFDLDAPGVGQGYHAATMFAKRVAAAAGAPELRMPDGEAWALVLWGMYGVGKTHLAAAVYNQLSAAGIGCLYTLGPDLWPALGATMDHDEDVSYEARIVSVARVPVLLIDEPAGTLRDDGSIIRMTDGAVKVRRRIIEHRYQRRLPTVFLANMHPERWDDPAVADRVTAWDNAVIEHGRESYRQHTPGTPWAGAWDRGEGE